MEILLIRHGEPDYANDTLTPRGHKEARHLAEFLDPIELDAIYQSPNGRAQHTAEYTASKKGIRPVTREWLREVGILRESLYLWNAPGTLFLRDGTVPGYSTCLEPEGEMPEGKEQFGKVSRGFDEVMATFGFVKEGFLYRVETEAKEEKIAFFAHHGVNVTLLSYLLHWPLPLVFVHTAIAPTGLTRLIFEEHEGYAQPRMVAFNSLAHLGR